MFWNVLDHVVMVALNVFLGIFRVAYNLVVLGFVSSSRYTHCSLSLSRTSTYGQICCRDFSRLPV